MLRPCPPSTATRQQAAKSPHLSRKGREVLDRFWDGASTSLMAETGWKGEWLLASDRTKRPIRLYLQDELLADLLDFVAMKEVECAFGVESSLQRRRPSTGLVIRTNR